MPDGNHNRRLEYFRYCPQLCRLSHLDSRRQPLAQRSPLAAAAHKRGAIGHCRYGWHDDNLRVAETKIWVTEDGDESLE